MRTCLCPAQTALGYFLGAPSALDRGLHSKRPSLKSFLRTFTGSGPSEIGPASVAAELHAALNSADYIRAHDVAAIHDALTVFEALETAKAGV
jgi:hypothetical protein